MKKRTLLTVLSLILVLSVIVPTAFARYTNISSLSADLSITSSGLSSPYGRVKLSNSTDTVKLTVELQQKNGSSWDTIKSWSTTGSGTVYLDKTWYVSSGYTYRTHVTADVSNSSGSLEESAELNSSTVTY